MTEKRTVKFMPEGYESLRIDHPDLDKALRQADQLRRADTTVLTIMRFMQAMPNETFRTMEQRLRGLGCMAHLVAVPAEVIPGPTPQAPNGFVVLDIQNNPRPFYVHVCSFGAAEAQDELRKLGVTPEENLQRLEQAGIIRVVPSGGASPVKN